MHTTPNDGSIKTGTGQPQAEHPQGTNPLRAARPRRAIAVLLTGLIACTSLSFLTPTPAVAEDKITHQDYMETFGFDVLRQKGLTGKGVTIAVIDGPADLTVPELQGANITQHHLCKESKNDEKHHATAILSVLASRDYGWAPDSTYILYATPLRKTKGEAYRPCTEIDGSPTAYAINDALNSKVDIISISLGGRANKEELAALTRASLSGTPVIVAAGNESQTDSKQSLAFYNGTVGVAATDLNGTLENYTNSGQGITISSPGGPVTQRISTPDGELGMVVPGGKGTSYAAPMVTGLMAIAMQQWPDATGNQITRSMIETAIKNPKGWDPHYGWGLINVKAMIENNPTTLENTNPLTNKHPDSKPDAAFIKDYEDGLILPSSAGENNNDYTYRGLEESYLRTHPERTEIGTSPRYDTPETATQSNRGK